MSEFTFGDNSYKIKSAVITGRLADPYWCDTYNRGKGKELAWFFIFEAKRRRDDKEDDDKPPQVQLDGDLGIQVASWKDLEGVMVKWKHPINKRSGERYGMTWDYYHAFICKGQLAVGHRTGTRFYVEASGIDENNAAFTINANARFTGITVHGSEHDTDETVRERLARHISLQSLCVAPFELFDHEDMPPGDNGVRIGCAHFQPQDS